MKHCVYIALIFVLSGCVSISGHTENTRFKDLVGKKTLSERAFICRREKIKMADGMEYSDEIVWQRKDDKCYLGETIAILEKGTTVEIYSLQEHKHRNLFHFENWYLLGKVSIDEKDKSFYYYYGSSTTSPGTPEFVYAPRWR